MNALAHYHLLSARLPSISADEAARHRADAKTILERLEVIDEDRKGYVASFRYERFN
jgi:hypothetical protein